MKNVALAKNVRVRVQSFNPKMLEFSQKAGHTHHLLVNMRASESEWERVGASGSEWERVGASGSEWERVRVF